MVIANGVAELPGCTMKFSAAVSELILVTSSLTQAYPSVFKPLQLTLTSQVPLPTLN